MKVEILEQHKFCCGGHIHTVDHNSEERKYVNQLIDQAIQASKEEANAWRNIAEGRSKLLVLYRTGSRKGYETALKQIEKGEKILEKYSPQQKEEGE